MTNITACHRCDRRQPSCAGSCACGVDGRDITAHAAANDCPLGRFGGPRRMTLTVLSPWLAGRMAVCSACPHRRGDACGLLPAGRNRLMGSRGIPKPEAQCPDDPPRWGPAETAG